MKGIFDIASVHVRKITVVLCIFLILLSCNTGSDFKTIHISKVALLEVPKEFQIIEKKGVDSHIFTITNGKGFILNGELGHSSSIAINPPIVVMGLSVKDSVLSRMNYKYDSTIVFFSDNVDEDKRQNTFSKNYYFYENIDGHKAKFLLPKKSEVGITGIIVYSVEEGSKLTIYGENLTLEQQQTALRIFKSIRILR